MIQTSGAASFSRRSSLPSVTLAVAAAVVAAASSASCCLAFNAPMKAARSTGTRLYDSYDDQYAQFYNGGPPQKPPGQQDEQQQQQVGDPAVPSAYGSYLDSLNGNTNGAPVQEQEEQVYYEATNSYAPPTPPAQPEQPPVAQQQQQQQQEPVNAFAATPPPPTSFATGATAMSPPPPMPEPIKVAAPPPPPPQKPLVSKRAPPLQYDSSPTLSAQSPTLSVTLPVSLRPPKLGKAKDISYGESSRKFRRTVYSHDDWVSHRSPDRFFKYIAAIPTSGIYKNLGREILSIVSIAMVVLVYNGFVTGYQDISGAGHPPIWSSPFLPPLTLPLQPFTLSSSSLGLLLSTFYCFIVFVMSFCFAALFVSFNFVSVPNSHSLHPFFPSFLPVFRSNTAYQRWDEARKNWGKNINHTRNLNRMANAYYDRTGISDEQRKSDLERVSLCTWAFVRSMKRHLSPESEDEAAFKAELYERLPKSMAQSIIKAAHRPNRALYDLSLAIENLPMHMMRKNEMHSALTIFEDNLGSSERLLTSPVPLIYNRHTARFLSVWLLLLPFGLWEPFGFMWNHIGMLPTMAMLGILLFGIEELATQMEEPFTILPMQAFCDKIGAWCDEISNWEDGTNGITTNRSYQGRTKVYADTDY